MKIRFAITLGLVHLALVIVGAAELDVSGSNPLLRLLRAYGSLSGSNANYSFFAPSVGSPLRATFYLTHENGTVVVEKTEHADRELTLRIGNMVDAFRDKLEDPVVRRSIAASWSGLVLSRHPSARSVRFVLDEYHIPKMHEFRAGEAMRWAENYSATFERRLKR